MKQLPEKLIRKGFNWVFGGLRDRRIGRLYAPRVQDEDVAQHLLEAVNWLRRAQDAGTDPGVSFGVRFGSDFDVSYPETTGYIIPTFLDLEAYWQDPDFLERAVRMGDWEVSIQLANGAVMGGKLNSSPSPALFNTGMVLLGWAALINRTGEVRYKDAARRAGSWMVSVQEPDGHWIQGHSLFARPGSTLYNVKAAWGLAEAGIALGIEEFVLAAEKNADYCITKQKPNGWFAESCLTDPQSPLLHTLAYTAQGLLGVAKITGREDFLQAARRFADAQIGIMGEDGYLPGRQSEDYEPRSAWSCLTGSAQMSVVFQELHAHTGQRQYLEGALRVNRYLMARHDIQNSDPRLRGGVPGSWPVWGEYGKLSVLNWATKYLVDALLLEQKQSSEGVESEEGRIGKLAGSTRRG